MGEFADNVALITGGASGIGKALGEAMAQGGCTVVLADIDAKQLDEAVSGSTSAGGRAEARVLDVSDEREFAAAIDEAIESHGRLDYLFNNAGLSVGGLVEHCCSEDWRRVIEVNLMGVIHGSTAAYTHMRRQGHGHIVNISSHEGLVPNGGNVGYVTSKFGVFGLTMGLRAEAAAHGIQGNVVCPGAIETRIIDNSKLINIDREKLVSSIPKWILMSPERCAQVILRGVARDNPIITVTRLTWISWFFYRLFPRLVIRHKVNSMAGLRDHLIIEERRQQ